ncbi:MAG: DUF962 domain-containing protein [Sulfurifustis sp.]
MRTLTDHLAQYAAYHRDRRNIATHFIGIPMIVFAVLVLLSRPSFVLLGVALNPAIVLAVVAGAFYLVLDLRFGIAMAVSNILLLWLAMTVAAQSTGVWLASGVALFVIGWGFQFVGHYWEGRKPAFVDDLIGLIIGPLFVMAEAAFALGLRSALRRDIEKRVGPTHIRTKTVVAG